MPDAGARRVLVTGGAGFIGAALVRELERAGHRVRVLDDGRACGFGHLQGTAAELIEGDVLAVDLGPALAGVDAVIHLAAQTGVGASIEDPLEDMRENVNATVRLLEASRAAAVGRFVLASSAAVLGGGPVPAREDAPPRPASPYGAAKLAAEGYLSAYHHSFGLPTTTLRFANAYGPRAAHKTSVVPSFIRHALSGRLLRIHGDGSQTRDFVHVDDIVQALTRVLDAPAEAVAGRIFHAGSGRETSVGELAEAVLAATGSAPATIEHLLPRPGEVKRSALDIGAARSVLGYEPKVALEAGIASTVAWFRGHPDTIGQN
jgi:UDP-glucose 4-epimerase